MANWWRKSGPSSGKVPNIPRHANARRSRMTRASDIPVSKTCAWITAAIPSSTRVLNSFRKIVPGEPYQAYRKRSAEPAETGSAKPPACPEKTLEEEIMRVPMTAEALCIPQQWPQRTPARKGCCGRCSFAIEPQAQRNAGNQAGVNGKNGEGAGTHATACSQWVRNTAQSTSGRSSSHRTAPPVARSMSGHRSAGTGRTPLRH